MPPSQGEPAMDAIAVADRPQLTGDALKARFRQLSLQTNNVHQNWQIRVHRAISWLRRADELPELTEARFLFFWITLNSLYSRWDVETNAPGRDTEARSRFV